ncbi:MAG: hypothetical protein IPL99_12240 [Candidatus Competibacteraceae bacterium]|nr:hypothetical protein [Candidatus Competibacteraceae bacterium]
MMFIPGSSQIRYEPLTLVPAMPLKAGELEWCKAVKTLFIGENDGTMTGIGATHTRNSSGSLSPVKLWFLMAR